MDEQSIISSCPRARRETHQLPLLGIHHMKRGWKRHLSSQLKNPYPAEDSLETSPGGTDLASSLGSRASKSFLYGVKLDRCRSASLQSSWVVVLGSGRCARGTDEDTVLLAGVVSGLIGQAVLPRKVRGLTLQTHLSWCLSNSDHQLQTGRECRHILWCSPQTTGGLQGVHTS